VAALIIVLSVVFITNSINLVSPSTEKAVDMKLTIKAQDTLVALGTVDQPSNFSSVLKRGLAAWTGLEAGNTIEIPPAEVSIKDLDWQIQLLLPPNMLYNLQIVYWNDMTGALETKTLIYHGDAQNLTYNAVSGSKKIVINDEDTQSISNSYWKNIAKPKTIEAILIIWSV
jgi:hypothetical protein